MNVDIRMFVKKTADRYRWSVQPDEEFLQTVLRGLEKTRETYGYFLCPCREGWGTRAKDRDIICPCEYAQEDIEEFGNCYCGLFVSEKKSSSGSQPETIPDRRPEDLYPD